LMFTAMGIAGSVGWVATLYIPVGSFFSKTFR